jgi:hypothetical protein
MFVEDLSAYFGENNVGVVDALVAGASVRGILDRHYAEPFGDVVAAATPTLTVPTADVPTVVFGSACIIDPTGAATSYLVRGIEPDGTGVTLLRLEDQ